MRTLQAGKEMVESTDRRYFVPTYEPGDFVKVEFKDEQTGESEWMWVKVEYSDETRRVVFGWLDNEPVVHSDKLKLGQRLAVSFDNIREQRSKAH